MTTSAYLRVANQPPPLEGYDLFSQNRPLVEALRREGAAEREEECAAFGRLCGGEPLELGRLANEHPPVLRTFDRFGERIDEVEFHPAWHELLRIGVENGLHAFPWADGEPGAHVARAARFVTLSQAEAGVGCPLSMTYAAVPALRTDAALAAEWEPQLESRAYEPGLLPTVEKPGVLMGMALTERQGGSDVRAIETRAEPLADGGYALRGEKWFCSAPMCDAFLVLAYAPGGLTCFVLPRVLADGERNDFRIHRLKDKLGNRSNASAEIELEDAWAVRLGEEGRGRVLPGLRPVEDGRSLAAAGRSREQPPRAARRTREDPGRRRCHAPRRSARTRDATALRRPTRTLPSRAPRPARAPPARAPCTPSRNRVGVVPTETPNRRFDRLQATLIQQAAEVGPGVVREICGTGLAGTLSRPAARLLS